MSVSRIPPVQGDFIMSRLGTRDDPPTAERYPQATRPAALHQQPYTIQFSRSLHCVLSNGRVILLRNYYE
ncbi:hypothetical protein JW935_28385 [candidate division KSB1 bacterium]|nr:hypothetical protein [candidate division KSB1 bacterium]